MKTEKEKEAARKASRRKVRLQCLIEECSERLQAVRREISTYPSEDAIRERDALEKEISNLRAQMNTAEIESEVMSDREIKELVHGEESEYNEQVSESDRAFIKELAQS